MADILLVVEPVETTAEIPVEASVAMPSTSSGTALDFYPGVIFFFRWLRSRRWLSLSKPRMNKYRNQAKQKSHFSVAFLLW
ncbi:hypothetical protein HY04_12900 [Kaistella antarctica]|uniref:Uncharacterized protein n=1 Tax=Kaistella antarctica TaxID=266748 RepID=A0ABR4U044_9FLAO|nr:hypothetical protein HY04_12900 [Kaistella antarctica]